MKISTKISVNFLVIFILIVSVSGFVIGLYFSNLIKQNFYSYLNFSSLAKANHIRTYIQDQEKMSVILAAASVYRDFLKEPKTSSQFSIVKTKIDKRLTRTLEADSQIIEASILDADGIVVASSEKNEEGKNKFQEDIFFKGKENVFLKDFYFFPTSHDLTYAIASPVKDDDGTFLGVSVLRYSPNLFFDVVKSDSNLKKTEESFLINQEKFFLTPSRFLGDSVILKQKVETQNSTDCFDPQEIEYVKKNGYSGLREMFGSQILQAKDYRQIKAIVTHVFIPETNWCLISKIDESDLFSFFPLMVGFLLLIFVFSGVVYFVISFFVAKRVTRPVSSLLLGTEKIKEGNFDYRVEIKTKDEMEALAESFNSMGSQLKKNYLDLQKNALNLEEKISEKTLELQGRVDDLKKIREAVLNVAEDAELEKEKTAKERDKINAILHSIGDGVFVVDRNLKILLLNEVTARLSGYSMEELLGTKYTEKLVFTFEDTGKINDQFINKAIETKTVQEMANHTVLKNKNGSEIQVADSAAPLLSKNGEVNGCVVVFRDVTKERMIDKTKTEFVSLASHQLRTPLTAISWYLEMLMNGKAGKLKPEQLKYLEEVYKGGNRMRDLVNALLNVSRIDLGTFAIDPEESNIKEICDSVIEEMKPTILTKKLKITKKYTDLPAKFIVDQKLFRIILQNLISNAVKYTPPKGKVDVQMEKRKEDILISVIDSGYGIPLKQQEKIFSKLFRADNAKMKDPDGTGLGLYIIKSILEHSGGKVWFESEEDKGSKFFVSLPLTGMSKKEGGKGLV